jgi:dolichol-phosphate mannosyltransferase
MDTPHISLIIPALNESKIILENIDELAEWMNINLSALSYEIIVVDDGSTDGMGDLLDQACNERSFLRVAHHVTNKGRGLGVRTGFNVAKGEYLICLDADLSYSPEHIPTLLEPLQKGLADITLASAHHPEGRVINVPAQRVFLSKWGNKILGLGFGGEFSTVTCIVRGFTREVAKNLELVNDGKELHLEIIQKAKLLGYRITEVPATLHWRDRKRGQRKNLKLIPEIAIFKMRKTVISHLIFNYISNPGILLLIPILLLLTIIVAGSSTLLYTFFENLNNIDQSTIQVLRQTFLDGQLTLFVVAFSFIFLMVFVGFYFLSFQNKRYFDEVYIIAMRMNSRLKKVESKLASKAKD